MKRLSTLLFALLALPAFPATVSVNFTNIIGQPDTNIVRVIPVGEPILANGGFITRGPGVRVQPDNTGSASVRLQQGNYMLTNAYLGSGILIAVPNDPANTYSMWQLVISGFNTYNYTPGIRAITSTNGMLTVTQLPQGVVDIESTNQFVAQTAIGSIYATNGSPSGFYTTTLTNSGAAKIGGTLDGNSIFASGGFFGSLIGNAATSTKSGAATNDDLGNKISTQFANSTNNSLALSANGTNFSLLIGANDTNQAWQIGANDTNQTWLVGANDTNQSLLIGANDTNQSWAIGLGATNDDQLFGVNVTNQSWRIGANATNDDQLFGINGTNQSWLIGSNGTNQSWAIGQNDTNQSWSIGLNGTNQSWLIGANGTNQTWAIGANDTNQTWKIGQNDTNQSLLIALNATNDDQLFGVNGTNQSWAIGANGTNQSWAIGANGTNQSWLIGDNGTNQSLKIGQNDTNQTWLIGANDTNQSWVIGANGTNQSWLIGQNGTNQSWAVGAATTNGAINNLSNLVSTISQNATNQSNKMIARQSGFGTNTTVYGDSNTTNAITVLPTGLLETNNLGSTILSGGNITNSGSITMGNYGSIGSANGPINVGGNLSMDNSIVPGLGGFPFVWVQGNFTATTPSVQDSFRVIPTITQGGQAGYAVIVADVNEVSLGSGLGAQHNLFEGRRGGSTVFNINDAGNQTNSGSIKAAGFIGPLTGNAATASISSIATNAFLATNLVNAAAISNAVNWVTGNNTWGLYNGVNVQTLMTETTNGAFSVWDVGGATKVFSYSGGSSSSDSTSMARLNNTIISGNNSNTRIFDPANTAQITVTAASTIVANPLGHQILVASKTANYSVLSADAGTYFNNNGAVVAITNTLPTAAVGLHYSMAVVANFNEALKASGSDTIRSVGTVSSAAGLVFSSTVGSTIHLYCPASGGWWIDSTNGTWTIQ